MPFVDELVEGGLVGLNILRDVNDAFLPKKLFGCSAVRSAGLMKEDHFSHNVPPGKNTFANLKCVVAEVERPQHSTRSLRLATAMSPSAIAYITRIAEKSS